MARASESNPGPARETSAARRDDGPMDRATKVRKSRSFFDWGKDVGLHMHPRTLPGEKKG